MRYRPIRPTATYFGEVIRSIVDRGWPLDAMLASTRPSAHLPDDPRLRVDADPRLMVLLAGRHRHAITQREMRVDCGIAPGRCLYWPGHAWNLSCWEKPCLFFGIVFRRTFTRFLMVDFPGGEAPVSATPHSLHTARPLRGAALHLLRGLDIMAEETGDPGGPARLMILALLQLGERHLRETDGPGDGQDSDLWQCALDHMNASYSDLMLSRDSVAASIGVHPNYLSALAAKNSDGFHHTLEDIRISHARHMLMRSPLRTREIATLCGYSGVTSFIRAFHRVMGEYPQRFRERGGEIR